jgi:hypothetical protein
MQDEFAPRDNNPSSGAFGGLPVGSWGGVARPVSANSYLANSRPQEKIEMFSIKKRKWCMACLSESATPAQPATIEVKRDSGVRVFLCEEHFKLYCRMVTDEDRQGASLN